MYSAMGFSFGVSLLQTVPRHKPEKLDLPGRSRRLHSQPVLPISQWSDPRAARAMAGLWGRAPWRPWGWWPARTSWAARRAGRRVTGSEREPGFR